MVRVIRRVTANNFVLVDFCRHLVGKNSEKVSHCDSA